jgi:regulator of sigma E protease
MVMTVHRGGQVLTLVAVPQQYIVNDNVPLIAQEVVKPNALASIGLKPGDVIFRVDGVMVADSDHLRDLLKTDIGKKADISIWRADQTIELSPVLSNAQFTVPPHLVNHPDGMLKVSLALKTEHLGFVASVKKGLFFVHAMYTNIRDAFVTEHGKQLKDSTGGIVQMYSFTGIAMRNGVSQVVLLAGQLSISLAIFNILPIPVLDGGHLLSYFIEAVRKGRKMTDAQQQAFMLTGLALIGVLFVFVFTNDIHKVITHQVPQ